MPRRRILPILLLFACGQSERPDPEVRDDSAPARSDDSDPGGADDSAASDDSAAASSAPVLESCDAFCWEHSTGDSFIQWLLECQASDPDGLETIKNGELSVTRGSSVVSEQLVACDDEGLCSSSFKESGSGVLCAEADSYTFTSTIQDIDGNWSEPLSVNGRQR